MSELSGFKEYVKEQQHLCYGVELGGTPAVVGSWARQYDFLLETIEEYQEINQPTLNENQQIVLEWFKEEHEFMLKHRTYFSFISCLDNVFTHHSIYIKRNLTNEQQAQVLQTFSQWVLEQEEK